MVAVMSDRRADVLREAEQLSRLLEAQRFRGFDPYDALASPILRRLAVTPLARRAAIQLMKRSPLNIRRVVGVPAQQHTKALALCVSAYALLADLPDGDRYRTLARALSECLVASALVRDGGVGWGYEFDVETRWGGYAADQPNAVVTSFAGNALLDAAALDDADGRLREPAELAARYAVTTLFRPTPEGGFFAYYSDTDMEIHNASALVVGLLSRCTPMPTDAADAAERAVASLVAKQRPDGSWPYGEHPRLQWVDGYHTAYILVSLGRWADATGDGAAETALRRGLGYYIANLFDPGGIPRATSTSVYPIDVHAASSAIWALSQLDEWSPAARPLADSVLAWTLDNLRRRDGRFAFQRHRRYRNSTSYIRWNDAHMLLALSSVARARSMHANH